MKESKFLTIQMMLLAASNRVSRREFKTAWTIIYAISWTPPFRWWPYGDASNGEFTPTKRD